MHKLKTLASALVVAAVLVVCADYATYAATGSSLILGRSNSASTLTTVTRTTTGSVLNLKTRSTASAPFSTNATGKVTHLDADLLDGLDSTALANTSRVYKHEVGPTPQTSTTFDVTPPAGTYLFSYNAFLQGAEGGNVECQLIDTGANGTTYSGVVEFTAGSEVPGLSASGVVTRAVGDTLSLQCGADNPFITQLGIPIQLVLSPTTVTSTATVPESPNARATHRAVAGR